MNGSDFALVGPGRLGLRLLLRMLERGYRCAAVISRHPLAAERRALLPSSIVCTDWGADPLWTMPRLVLITVPDHLIAPVAADLAARHDLSEVTVLHTSGLLTAEVLAPCRESGALAASWHPLQSFPPLELGSVRWDGIACAVEGDPPAVATGFAVARALGLRPWSIPSADKEIYHAAASVAANLTYVLVASARDLLGGCGLPATPPDHPLRPLVEAAVRAALTAPGLEGLTGPLARGDSETIARHLAVLPPALSDAYQALIRVAGEMGGVGGRHLVS